MLIKLGYFCKWYCQISVKGHCKCKLDKRLLIPKIVNIFIFSLSGGKTLKWQSLCSNTCLCQLLSCRTFMKLHYFSFFIIANLKIEWKSKENVYVALGIYWIWIKMQRGSRNLDILTWNLNSNWKYYLLPLNSIFIDNL